jgi:hypothetical protein
MKLFRRNHGRSPELAGSRSSIRRITTCAALFAAAFALFVGTSSVASAEAVTQTIILHDVTQTSQDVNPCTGDPVIATSTYNAVFSYTIDPQGGVHVTGTVAGTYEVVPVDPGLPTYTGHFASWFGESSSSNSDGDWATFNVKLKGSDGSTLSVNSVLQFHVSNGVLHVEFEKTRLSCGT